MIVRLRFFKFAWYIGAFYSTRYNTLYIHPIPCFGISVRFNPSAANCYANFDLPGDEFNWH